MNRLLLNSFLLYVVLAVLGQACNEDQDEQEKVNWEKPVTITKVKARKDSTGYSTKIVEDTWDPAIVILGSGTFISAVVSKKDTSSDTPAGRPKTTINLTLDECEVLLRSFEVADAMGLKVQNYSGVVWLQGLNGGEAKVETMVLGFAQPLHFNESLVLSINVDDPQIQKVFLSVTYTKEDTGEDENSGGGDGAPPFP